VKPLADLAVVLHASAQGAAAGELEQAESQPSVELTGAPHIESLLEEQRTTRVA
jgi:hypothetical protein